MSKPGQQVLITLRKMIASGELPAGERLAEIPTAESLGVSRTPVRMAFQLLEQEGLLVKSGARGYVVRAISHDDIMGAIEVRGVLEGLAARQAAEKGLSGKQIKALQECLDTGYQLFAKGYITEADLDIYYDLNVRFHQIIIEASGNSAIGWATSRNDNLPFASVKALAIDRNNMEGEFRRFNYAHMQHYAVFDALIKQQGARAEAIMREHANATLHYAELFTSLSAHADNTPPGMTVIQK